MILPFLRDQFYNLNSIIFITNFMDLTVGKSYKLTKKLNSGSFGEIYMAINIKNNREVAVKLEPITAKHPQLQYQAKLLAYILGESGQVEGFPSLYFFGKDSNFSIMVIDLLGPSLEELFQRCEKRFTLKTTVMVGLQIIDRLQYMHTHKFIHRDIKPENFLLGIYQKCTKVHIIDFGLSKKYVQKDGSHIPYKDNKSLTGTPRYASINSHLGIQQSRRDDLESVIYMLIYFMKGCLPWQNLKNDGNYGKYQKILQKKLSVSIQVLTKDLPREFEQMLEYTQKLHFTEEPNYNLYRKLMEQALLNQGIELNIQDKYCWEQMFDKNDQEHFDGGGFESGKRKDNFDDYEFEEL